MKRPSFRRLLLIALPVLALGLVLGYYAALRVLRQQITAALGATGEVERIDVSLDKVVIEGLRIKASRPGWPTTDELRASRVSVTPDLRSLLGGAIVIRRIQVEDAALTVLRSKAGMKILPALLDPAPKPHAEKTAAKAESRNASSLPLIRIGTVELRNSRIDFYDATIAARPHHISLDQLALTLEKLRLPDLDERAPLQLKARVAEQGTLALNGWLVPANMDSDLKLSLNNLPLKLVEPYLFKGKAGEVKAGRAALELHARVSQRKLSAPGHLSLTQLELGGVAGFTREALAALARSKGLDADTRRPVDLDFSLQGNLDDARFSLNEAIYAQAGLASLQLLGLNVSSSRSGKDSTSGLGSVIKGLFGR
ncbi:MAG: DUF748 domain-containing protein [Uliginosibacterium sp.]|nr:DUF748 domain-containing protein [Uliginosibacterium sp.]